MGPELTGYPLSPAQEAVWMAERLRPPGSFNVATLWRVEGALEPDWLRAALDLVCRRHGTLRTSVHETSGGAVQRIAEPGDGAGILQMVDLSTMESGRARAELRSRADREARTPFDVGRPPLLRAVLFALEESHLLLLVVHHLVADGASVRILLRDLLRIYDWIRGGGPFPLRPTALEYREYAVWRRRRLAGPIGADLRTHWRSALRGYTPGPLPEPREPREERPRQPPLRLDPETVASLRKAARAHGATLHMALLAAFRVALGEWLARADLAVGVPWAGRPAPELEDVVGLFANVVVVRTITDPSAPPARVLARVREALLDAMDHGELPYEEARSVTARSLEPERAPFLPAVFQVHAFDVGLRSEVLALDREPLPLAGSRFPLEVYLRETWGGLSGELVVDPTRVDPAAAGRLADRFLAIARAFPAGLAAAPAGQGEDPAGAYPPSSTGPP